MEQKDFSKLPTWLPEKIEALGMSFEQFARACELTRAMIYFYVSDKYRPDENTMIRMCQVLGVPPEEGLSQYSPRRRGRKQRRKKR